MKTIGERLVTWRKLFDGLTAHPEDAAELAKEHAELGRCLEEIQEQMYQADKHEAGLREANRRRLELERQTAELHGRIAFLLRGRHGKRSNHLQGFGLEPHGVRARTSRRRPKSRTRRRSRPASGRLRWPSVDAAHFTGGGAPCVVEASSLCREEAAHPRS